MKQLLIKGASGLGREVLAWARQSDGHSVDKKIDGFLDGDAHENLHRRIDHDATVDDWSQINCRCDISANANARIGREVWLSINVMVAPRITIGDRAYVGASLAVLRNVEPGKKVFGVTARRFE